MSVDNLLSNFKTRSGRASMPPIIDAIGTVSTTINSCYKVLTTTILASNNKYVLGFKLQVQFFVHNVVFLQDVQAGYPG